MNIIEVGEKLPKFTGSMVKACGDDYWFVTGNGIFNQDDKEISPCRAALLATDYELYEEIRPRGKEIWIHEERGLCITFKHKCDPNDFEGCDERGKIITSPERKEIIHGQNGWQRIHPPVEDERVEIELVGWKEWGNLICPYDKTDNFNWRNLLGKSGKLIFIPNK